MTEFKFHCPQCGQQIQCGTSYSGTQINCPVCQQAIVVPQAALAETSQPPVATKSGALKNVLTIIVAMIVLAGLAIGGWYGYTKIKIYNQRGHLPPGLVASWSGEGGGNDLVSGNKMILTDVSFAEGKVGRAFVLNGSSSSLKIPAASALNVGAGKGLTISAWIKPGNLNKANQWLAGWAAGPHVLGGMLKLSQSAFGQGPGCLFVNLVDDEGASHCFSSPRVLQNNVFQHIALTYDKTAGTATFYRNGIIVARQNLGSFALQTTYPFVIGIRPYDDGLENGYEGLLDKVGIYNRALSAAEIRADFEAGNKN
jgi:ribosomal protein S27E